MNRHPTMPVVERVVVRREPMPRPVVPKADPHTPRSIVSGDEPPHVRVEIPPRMHEDIVHPFCDAVPVHPEVLSIGVVPVPINPNRPGAVRNGLLDHDRPWRRRCLLGCHDGLRLLNDDHRLSIDLLGRAFLGLDDHIGRRIGCLARLSFARVTIVRDVVAVGRRAVAVRPFVVSGRGERDADRDRQCGQRREPNEEIHGSSFTCMPGWLRRHPPSDEQAPPARQNAEKVLGFRRF